MRHDQILNEVGFLDYIRALQQSDPSGTGSLSKMPITQRAAQIEKDRNMQALADQLYTTFAQQVGQYTQAKVAAGESGEIEANEYTRVLNNFVQQIIGFNINDVDVDNVEAGRIKAVMSTIVSNRNRPNTVKAYFKSLMSTMIAAKALGKPPTIKQKQKQKAAKQAAQGTQAQAQQEPLQSDPASVQKAIADGLGITPLQQKQMANFIRQVGPREFLAALGINV